APALHVDRVDVGEILETNRFVLVLPQAITSAYKHSCSFFTTAFGDSGAGEPEVVVMARSAEWSSALWDDRRRVISAAMATTEVDKTTAQPTAMDVYLPHVVLTLARRPSGAWV